MGAMYYMPFIHAMLRGISRRMLRIHGVLKGFVPYVPLGTLLIKPVRDRTISHCWTCMCTLWCNCLLTSCCIRCHTSVFIHSEGHNMRLSDQLIAIASGSMWSEVALLDAMDIDWLSDDEWSAVENYLRGEIESTDHVTLQGIANRLKSEGL